MGLTTRTGRICMIFFAHIWMKPYRMQRSWKNSTRVGRPVSLHRAQWYITLSKRFDLTFEYAYHSKYSHIFEVIFDLWLYLSLRADSLFVVMWTTTDHFRQSTGHFSFLLKFCLSVHQSCRKTLAYCPHSSYDSQIGLPKLLTNLP